MLFRSDQIKKFCPVDLPADAAANLKSWREQFAAPPPTSDSAIGEDDKQDENTEGNTGGNTEGNTEGKPEDKKIAVGEVASPEELESYGEKVAKEVSLPDSTPTNMSTSRLVLAKTKSGKNHVWLRNVGKKDVTTPVNLFVGQGGPGQFVSLVAAQIAAPAQKFAWKYNRITNHKKDSATHANGSVVWSKESAAIGAKPNLVTLDGVEKALANTNLNLYAHSITRGGKVRVTITPSPTPIWWHPEKTDPPAEDAKFDWQTLGHYYPSGDDVGSASGLVSGALRPAFEVLAKVQPGNEVQLAPNPNKGASPLFLFSKDKMTIPTGKYI